MKTFAIGDIHGAYKALKQCLKSSNFNKKEDKLIVLGDVCDGWSEVTESIDELLTIKNLIYILGNHDQWVYEFLRYGNKEDLWIKQGGQASLDSFKKHGLLKLPKLAKKYIEFFENAYIAYIDKDKNLFVHGGVDFENHTEIQNTERIPWDRKLMQKAWNNQNIADKQKLIPKKLTPFKNVYIGHTSTLTYGRYEPIFACEVINLDTGAGWGGKLTIMDIKTKEYWQSDYAKQLYYNEFYRR